MMSIFQTLSARIIEWTVTGKPIQAFLAEATNISRKTWDAGGPKRARAQAKAADEITAWGIRGMRDKGISDADIDAWLASFPKTTKEEPYCLSMLIRCFPVSQEPPPETLALAIQMDELAHELGRIKCSNDFVAYKHALLSEPFLGRNYFADTERELKSQKMPLALCQTQSAADWDELDIAVKAVAANSLLSLMACWDLEFCQRYSPLMKPFPFFESVMLRLSHDPQVNPKLGRDAIHRPTRILLDLLAMLGGWLRNHKQKPLRKITVGEMATWLELGNPQIPAQKLWNWRRGRDAFLLEDLDVVWRGFTGVYNDKAKNREIPNPPFPLFVATQIWDHLQFQVDEKNRPKSLFLIQPWYLWWWEHHRARLTAKGITWGDSPWPASIRNQSTWSGARSPDSSRSSQSSGRPSKSRESQ